MCTLLVNDYVDRLVAVIFIGIFVENRKHFLNQPLSVSIFCHEMLSAYISSSCMMQERGRERERKVEFQINLASQWYIFFPTICVGVSSEPWVKHVAR